MKDYKLEIGQYYIGMGHCNQPALYKVTEIGGSYIGTNFEVENVLDNSYGTYRRFSYYTHGIDTDWSKYKYITGACPFMVIPRGISEEEAKEIFENHKRDFSDRHEWFGGCTINPLGTIENSEFYGY